MTVQADSPPRAESRRAFAVSTELKAFVSRLHFYIGLFVGPFILIAAITGTLYVVTPQIETYLYRDQLTTTTTGAPATLAAQAAAARAHIGEGPRLFAVRPAEGPGFTTRIMFAQPGLGESESRAIFIDPVSLKIQGDMIVYGTSGTLPFRTQLDYLHRNLMLGDLGRNYSELAASWLWVVALGGIAMYVWRRHPDAAARAKKNPALATRRLHGLIGLWLSVGLVFLSITGLTWSKYAGDRIDALRGQLNWVTPSVTTKLGPAPVTATSGHAGHDHDHGAEAGPAKAVPSAAEQLDPVLAKAREAGIDSPFVEVRPPRAEGQAWLIREYDRSWPTQVDTITIDPRDLSVTSRADFATFGIIPKLIRWGIDAHMGILFGLPNQLLMASLGILLATATILGYRIWWRQRPAAGSIPRTVAQAWLRLNALTKAGVVAFGIALGWALPLVGISLALFVLVDIVRWRMTKPPAA